MLQSSTDLSTINNLEADIVLYTEAEITVIPESFVLLNQRIDDSVNNCSLKGNFTWLGWSWLVLLCSLSLSQS